MNSIDAHYTQIMATVAALTFPIGFVGLGYFFYLENIKTKKSIKQFISNYDASVQRNILYLERNLYKLTLEIALLKKYSHGHAIPIPIVQTPQIANDTQTQTNDTQTQTIDTQTEPMAEQDTTQTTATQIPAMQTAQDKKEKKRTLFSQTVEGFDWLY